MNTILLKVSRISQYNEYSSHFQKSTQIPWSTKRWLNKYVYYFRFMGHTTFFFFVFIVIRMAWGLYVMITANVSFFSPLFLSFLLRIVVVRRRRTAVSVIYTKRIGGVFVLSPYSPGWIYIAYSVVDIVVAVVWMVHLHCQFLLASSNSIASMSEHTHTHTHFYQETPKKKPRVWSDCLIFSSFSTKS